MRPQERLHTHLNALPPLRVYRRSIIHSSGRHFFDVCLRCHCSSRLLAMVRSLCAFKDLWIQDACKRLAASTFVRSCRRGRHACLEAESHDKRDKSHAKRCLMCSRRLCINK